MTPQWLRRKVVRERLFLHDAFFRTALQSKGVLPEIIETVTGKKLEVESSDTQVSVENPGAHSIILDSICREADGSIWNVELQNYAGPDLIGRMSFYSSLLRARSLKKGMKYSELPNVCVIFITTEDVLNLGFPLYAWEPCLKTFNAREKRLAVAHSKEIARFLDDGCRKYIVNATVRDGSRISKLSEALTSTELIYPRLFPSIYQMKKELLWTDTGRKEMTVLLDEHDKRNWDGGVQEGVLIGRKEGWKKGRKRGREEGREEGRDLVNHELSMLAARLMADCRFEDVAKIVMDVNYRTELLNFYFPEGVPVK